MLPVDDPMLVKEKLLLHAIENFAKNFADDSIRNVLLLPMLAESSLAHSTLSSEFPGVRFCASSSAQAAGACFPSLGRHPV